MKILHRTYLFLLLCSLLVIGANLGAQTAGSSPSFGVTDYLGAGSHSPEFTMPPVPDTGKVVGSRDLHFGLRLQKYLPGGFYVSLGGHVSRFQNELTYTRETISTTITNDSIVNVKKTTRFNLKNDYLMVDTRLGVGKVFRYHRWGLDVQAGLGYRVWTDVDADFITAEEERQKANSSNLLSLQGNLHFTIDLHARYYVDKDSYFLVGAGYQNSRSLNLVNIASIEDTTLSFSSTSYYAGFGFDF